VDVIVKTSGGGVHDELLEREVLSLRRGSSAVVFWDMDAPATLERIENEPQDPFRALIPHYDLIFTHGGGTPVVTAYLSWGARDCISIYNARDPQTHHTYARRALEVEATLEALNSSEASA
jgi:spore maturation protein CgeB